MKTVLLFPGLDALFLASKMKRWLNSPAIVQSLSEASTYLSEITNQPEDLKLFLETNSRPHMNDFDRTLVALTALQVGIFRSINESVKWDIAVGCSHGDIARSVTCGIIPYQKAVAILWIFADIRKHCPKGYTANVRTSDNSPLLDSHITWLTEQGFEMSRWSDVHATIGGTEVDILALSEACIAKDLKVKPVLPYPVHSKTMIPAMEQLNFATLDWELGTPHALVFSSVWIKYLETSEDFRSEALAGAILPVRWMETLEHLYHQEGVTKFINIGPSNTLTNWLFESPRFTNLELVDAWDLNLNPVNS